MHYWSCNSAVEFSKNTIFVGTQHSIAITIKYILKKKKENATDLLGKKNTLTLYYVAAYLLLQQTVAV